MSSSESTFYPNGLPLKGFAVENFSEEKNSRTSGDSPLSSESESVASPCRTRGWRRQDSSYQSYVVVPTEKTEVDASSSSRETISSSSPEWFRTNPSTVSTAASFSSKTADLLGSCGSGAWASRIEEGSDSSPSFALKNRLPLMDILRAQRIYSTVKETSLDKAVVMSEELGNNIYFKREDLQPVFSFKLRGAFNRMVQLTTAQRSLGVCACSAGNHAQGVAYSAGKLCISAKIFMPITTPVIKVDAVRRLKAEVVLTGNNFDEAAAACRNCAETEGRVLVHPFDDPEVIAGQGTIGMEILKQHSSFEEFPLEAIFIPVGGGGLIAGVGSCIKAICPDIKIIAVEAADSAGMTASLKAGQVTTLKDCGTFADGTAVRTVGSNTFRICYDGSVVDETIICTTDEICAAIKDGFTDVRVVLEPSGALSIAGMRQYIQRYGPRNSSFVAILSGANMDFNRLRFVSTRADTTEHLMALSIPEKAGMFRKVYDILYPRCVTEFSYRITETSKDERLRSISNNDDSDTQDVTTCQSTTYNGTISAVDKVPKVAHVMVSFRCLPGSNDTEDFQHVRSRMKEEGFRVFDLQKSEMAKVHGRHLVGGRSQAAKDELLCRFEYPERPGSLQSFVHVLPQQWNVSLFHYRNHGADVGRILAGIQVPQESRLEFSGFIAQLEERGYTCINETSSTFYKLFLRHCKLES